MPESFTRFTLITAARLLDGTWRHPSTRRPSSSKCWVSSRLTPGFGCRARAGTRCLGGPARWLERGKFFGRRAALKGEGEPLIVVRGLPAP